MQDMDLKCRTLQDMQDIVDTMRLNLIIAYSRSKCRTMQDNAGHFGAFLQDIDIAKCRTLQDISPEKMKNAGQCSTFLPSSKKNTELYYFSS